MKTEVKNDNELIAEFMGGHKYGSDSTGICWEFDSGFNCDDEDVKYHRSWDWLMPVVQKIFDTEFGEKFEDWRVLNGRIVNAISRIDIIDAHKKVVEFIRWYNSQTTSNPEQSYMQTNMKTFIYF